MGDGRPLVPRLVNAWCLSVIGALVGIATLPWIFSQTYCTIICTPWGFILVGRFYFPYVPSMFAPVIAAHAAFFYLDWRFVGFGARKLGMGGVIVLALLAVVSISIQAAGWFVGPAYLLAGLTAVGYFLVAASLLRQLSVAPFASLFGDGSARPEGL